MNDENALWLVKGDWKSYEAYVLGTLSETYPRVVFESNVMQQGRMSGVLRQIDILAKSAMPVALECKYYARKVDVKCVEAFLSMMDDLGILIGIIVTAKGYTKAAKMRAGNDPRALSLEIIAPDKLSEYQFVGDPIIYRDTVAVSFKTPLGWVADTELSEDNSGPLVTMYPLGRSLHGAMQSGAIVYADILTRPDGPDSLVEISKSHELSLLADNLGYEFSFKSLQLADSNDIQRNALLRIAKGPPPIFGSEYALYVEYDTAVLMIVLNSPSDLDAQALALLMQLYETSFEKRII